MCESEDGPPTPESFRELVRRVKEFASRSYLEIDRQGERYEPSLGFTQGVRDLDALRFGTGWEWGNPAIGQTCHELIFTRDDPAWGLLCFVLCCWLDRQASYEVVWRDRLRRIDGWLVKGADGEPPVGLQGDRRHVRKTLHTIGWPRGSIADWFVDTVHSVGVPNRPGNLYRFASRAFGQLLAPALRPKRNRGNLEGAALLEGGQVAFLGDWKRLWMAIMFLRRDRSHVKCLLERAVQNVPRGEEALCHWYDDSWFPEVESELPVDGRLAGQMSRLFGKRLSCPHSIGLFVHDMARRTRTPFPPSALDVLFFAADGGNETDMSSRPAAD